MLSVRDMSLPPLFVDYNMAPPLGRGCPVCHLSFPTLPYRLVLALCLTYLLTLFTPTLIGFLMITGGCPTTFVLSTSYAIAPFLAAQVDVISPVGLRHCSLALIPANLVTLLTFTLIRLCVCFLCGYATYVRLAFRTLAPCVLAKHTFPRLRHILHPHIHTHAVCRAH